MTPRQARRERRTADRKAKKAEIKRAKAEGFSTAVLSPALTHSTALFSDPEFSSEFIAGAEASPAPRPGRSTGPRSVDGKATASRNSFKHGLASGQLIIPGEDPAEYESLLNSLLAEHQPADPTEDMLVRELAQSWWLMQRATAMQNDCFTGDGVAAKQLALFLRYYTTYERAFHRALNTLLRMKKERARQFVSQGRGREGKFVSQQALETPPQTASAPSSATSEGDLEQFVSHAPPLAA